MPRRNHYPEHRDRILTLVGNAAARHASAPSIRVIAADLGVGVATAHSYVARLTEEGLIECAPNRHRALKLTPLGFQHWQQLGGPRTCGYSSPATPSPRADLEPGF